MMMARMLSRWISGIVVLIVCCTAQADGQKLNTKLTTRDVKNIKAQAELTLSGLTRVMNTVADPSLSPSDLDEVIANAFIGDSRIFYQNEFEVDDDTDPDNATSDLQSKKISSYLRQFRNFYKQNKATSIRHEVTQVSDIYVGQTNLYLKVYYTQHLGGKSVDGKAYPKRYKVAEMQVIPIRGQHQTLINAINFADKQETGSKTTVTIVDADSDTRSTSSADIYTEAYCRQKLQAGTKLLSESNFTEAFFALKEAQKHKATEGEADNRTKEVYAKIRALSIDPIEYLYNGLTSRAQSLRDKYRFEEAKRYYAYAQEVKPASSKAIGIAMNAISEQQAKEEIIWNLFNKGSYAEAAKGFRTAISKGQSDNPNLHIGAARAYAAMSKFHEAEDAFGAAIKADPGYAETYKWYGLYKKQRKDYAGAFDAFVNFQSRADEPNDPIVNSEMAYCRGKLLKDPAQSLEFFKSAVTFNDRNLEARLELADAYLRMKDIRTAKKVVKELLEADNSFGEAYALQARMLEADNDKPAAAESYKMAIRYEPTNFNYYYELGKLQMTPELARYEDAIQNFSLCINAPVKSINNRQAYWKRGKCYYALGNRNEDAYKDFLKADEVMPTAPSAFYVDYGNLLIRLRKYDEAVQFLSKALADPGASLSLGVVNYLLYPQDEEKFLNYFERAFRDGVASDAVKSEPVIATLYEHNKKFKSLLKKYKYASLL